MLPAHLRDGTVRADEATPRQRRSWLGVALRIARDAAIAIALMASVPIVMVSTQDDATWKRASWGNNTRAGIKLGEGLRPLVLPKDESITPLRAGQAFHAIQSSKESADFPQLPRELRAEPIWNAPIPDGLLSTVTTPIYNGPSISTIFQAVAKGVTPAEMAYLRTLATDPAWKDFDIVARAPAVDFLGARFKLPFSPNATADNMPLPGYASSRHMAYAGVSRAAYHLAIGQRDSAETVLRAILSYGFNMIDHGTTVIDQLIGNVVVGVGRAGMRNFYEVTNDPRAKLPALQQVSKEAAARAMAAVQISSLRGSDVRSALLARAADPSATRAERFEFLHLLSYSSCSNVRELLFGPSAGVTDAYRNARTTLARYPSEQAFVDLLSRPVSTTAERETPHPIETLAISAATVAGTSLGNPRFASCTRILLD